MKKLFYLFLLLLPGLAFAQVDVSKPINLSGGGANSKLTGIENVSAPKDAVSAEVLQKGSLVYADASTNSGNTYSIDLTPDLPLTAGMVISFRANVDNTGSASLIVDGQAAKTIRKYVTGTLSAGELAAGKLVTVIYDGTDFQLLSQEKGPTPSGSQTLIYTSDGF